MCGKYRLLPILSKHGLAVKKNVRSIHTYSLIDFQSPRNQPNFVTGIAPARGNEIKTESPLTQKPLTRKLITRRAQ